MQVKVFASSFDKTFTRILTSNLGGWTFNLQNCMKFADWAMPYVSQMPFVPKHKGGKMRF
jgi:hypothetical protein